MTTVFPGRLDQIFRRPDRDHYKPTGHGEQFAADISVLDGNPHARIIGEVVHHAMLARLWTPLGGSVLSTNATAGVHVTEWDFGTIQYNNNTPTPTGCDALNNPAFQILIPIIDAFYDPPTVAVVCTWNSCWYKFGIDLFELQQVRFFSSLIHRDETYETLMQLITQSMQRLLKNTAIEPAPGRFIFDSNSPANTS
ncbi:hypothetical protein GLOIN_2v1670669 [Rhizophagus irregularis DAOM 181602=DAOM 197198]|nr:hypothetical protein GLOIN_2v1670669 [Rhizophagus irregularis DAOM 181602=DAOM 197198]